MKKIFFLLITGFPFFLIAQKTITGKVFDAGTRQPLAQANIVTKATTHATTTGNDGNFLMELPAGEKTIVVSYAGYERRSINVEGAEKNYSIALEPLVNQAVSVIASRNMARTNLQTPVPVDIIPVTRLAKETSQIDLNQLLTYAAPSFQSSRQAVADGTDHVDPAQLRGLGSDQVLVLINGKRRHQSALVNVNGTVNRGQTGTDLNSIPVSAIERVEVLRDGAAAQYGSDAIAGVINIVLKKTTHILTGNVSFGENISAYEKDYALNKLSNKTTGKVNVQDGGAFQAGINYGFTLHKKGYLNITGAYALRDKSNRSGTYTGPVYANVGGINRDDSILQSKHLTRNDFDMRIGNSKIATAAVIVNSAYAISHQWSLKLFGGFSQKNGEAAGFFRYPSSISASAGSFTSQALALYPNGFLPLIKSNIKDYSFSIGLEGKIGRWNASLSNTFGVNRFDFDIDHSVNYTRFAVTSIPQTSFDAGGLQFLQNTVNADLSRNFNVLQGLNLAYGAEFRVDQYTQHAGELSSYQNFNTNSGAAAGAQVFSGFVPDYAKQHARSNIAAYVDLEQDITRQWLLALALRFENYSDFGSTLNYKIATRYNLGDHFTVRAAASTGFRAPSMQQQFYAKTNTLFVSTPAGLVPTESGTFTNDSKPAEILGIPKLKEETSRNFSAGFTATPAPGFDISVDAYLVTIKNRIILTNNFNGGTDTVLTRLLKETGATTANFFTNAIDTKSKGLEAVLSYHTAFANQHTLRFSIAATWMKSAVEKEASGKPLIRASDILVASGQLGNYFNREDQSRIEVANPQCKANFTIHYSYKKLSAMLRITRFGKVTYLDPSINPANPGAFPVNAFTGQKETLDQVFSAKTITDVSLSYAPVNAITLTIGAGNLFDVYQDKHTHSGNVSLGRFIYSRRVQQMGFNGRYVFARLSFNLNTNK